MLPQGQGSESNRKMYSPRFTFLTALEVPLDRRGGEPSLGLTLGHTAACYGGQWEHSLRRCSGCPSSCAQATQRQAQGLSGPMQDPWAGSHFTTSSGAPAVHGAILQCCCCLVSVAITSDGRALPGRGCETTSLSQFPHARCSTFAAVASLRHKPPILDTCWLGGWPSQVPLPLSMLPTYQFLPVFQGRSPAPWVLTHDPCPPGFSLMGSMPLCPNGCG